MKQLTCLLAFVLIALPLQAFEQNTYLSHQLTNKNLIVETKQGQISFNAYSDSALAVQFLFANDSNKAAHLPSFAIKEAAINATFTVNDSKNKLTLALGKLTAVINKSPFSISYYQGEKLLFAEESGFFTGTTLENEQQHKIQGFRFKLSEHEKLLGGGERVLGMDRRGHRMPLYNRAHYGYETQSNQMNFSIPAVLSSNKYILLFDNSAKGWLDIGKTEHNILQFEAVSGRMSYLIFSGDSYPELINNYVDVTGKQPMPPRWALGNYASRFGYRTEQEVRDTVNKFIELDFPLDALILDLYWFGKDIKGHMGNLDWDKEAFPTPIKMISDIKAQGVNTVLITEPFVLTTSKKWHDAGFKSLHVAVNVSPRQFQGYDIEKTVEEVLEESKLEAKFLVLEITETIVVDSVNSANNTLDALKKLGVSISIDDFGSGYSNFSRLNEMPIDEIKIDKSIVQAAENSSDARVIVDVILMMAKKLNMLVTAEGVETVDQREYLKEKQCNHMQGYLFSPPVTVEKFGEILKKETI